MNILIIEDDPLYRTSMEMILRKAGFVVSSAVDGQSGVDMVQEKRPDLILCDIMMPDLDGRSVLKALKNDHGTADIPFIFVTAMGERADIRRGMSDGADDYLPKPFSSDELIEAVNGRLRRHELTLQKRNQSQFQKERAILISRLTSRELEVLLMVGQGGTSREIAAKLGVALKTIEVHRANIMRKLKTPNAAALARWAVIAERMQNDPE